MAEDNILKLMVAHHALLNVLFELFKVEAKEKSSRVQASLSELAWETKKHFFAEENAVFDFIIMENYGVLEVINQLKDEHIEMLNQLKKFSEKVPEISDEELEKFHALLESHREVEEKNLYPKLDKEMRPEQKQQIVARINEIPLTK
jgi:iron-sulfur cluster repair protein YtfE (RIC family)